jgi:hypothetical protein
MSRKLDWTLLLIQPFNCRPLLPVSPYSGHFAPDFAPGFAPEIHPARIRGFSPNDQAPVLPCSRMTQWFARRQQSQQSLVR